MSVSKQIATLLFNMGLNQKVDPVSAELGYVERLQNFKFVKDGRVDAVRPLTGYKIDHSDITGRAISYLETISEDEFMAVLNDGIAAIFKKGGPRDVSDAILTDSNLFWQSQAKRISREHTSIEVSSYDEDDDWSAACWLVRDGTSRFNLARYRLKYRVEDKKNNIIRTERHFNIELCSKCEIIIFEGKVYLFYLNSEYEEGPLRANVIKFERGQKGAPDFATLSGRTSPFSIPPFINNVTIKNERTDVFERKTFILDLKVIISGGRLKPYLAFLSGRSKIKVLNWSMSGSNSDYRSDGTVVAESENETNFVRTSRQLDNSLTLSHTADASGDSMKLCYAGLSYDVGNSGIKVTDGELTPSENLKGQVLGSTRIAIDDAATSSQVRWKSISSLGIPSFAEHLKEDYSFRELESFLSCGDRLIPRDSTTKRPKPSFLDEKFQTPAGEILSPTFDVQLRSLPLYDDIYYEISGTQNLLNAINPVPNIRNQAFNFFTRSGLNSFEEDNELISSRRAEDEYILKIRGITGSITLGEDSSFRLKCLYYDNKKEFEDDIPLVDDFNVVAVFQKHELVGTEEVYKGIYIFKGRLNVEERGPIGALDLRMIDDTVESLFNSLDFNEDIRDIAYCHKDKSFYFVSQKQVFRLYSTIVETNFVWRIEEVKLEGVSDSLDFLSIAYKGKTQENHIHILCSTGNSNRLIYFDIDLKRVVRTHRLRRDGGISYQTGMTSNEENNLVVCQEHNNARFGIDRRERIVVDPRTVGTFLPSEWYNPDVTEQKESSFLIRKRGPIVPTRLVLSGRRFNLNTRNETASFSSTIDRAPLANSLNNGSTVLNRWRQDGGEDTDVIAHFFRKGSSYRTGGRGFAGGARLLDTYVFRSSYSSSTDVSQEAVLDNNGRIELSMGYSSRRLGTTLSLLNRINYFGSLARQQPVYVGLAYVNVATAQIASFQRAIIARNNEFLDHSNPDLEDDVFPILTLYGESLSLKKFYTAARNQDHPQPQNISLDEFISDVAVDDQSNSNNVYQLCPVMGKVFVQDVQLGDVGVVNQKTKPSIDISNEFSDGISIDKPVPVCMTCDPSTRTLYVYGEKLLYTIFDGFVSTVFGGDYVLNAKVQHSMVRIEGSEDNFGWMYAYDMDSGERLEDRDFLVSEFTGEPKLGSESASYTRVQYDRVSERFYFRTRGYDGSNTIAIEIRNKDGTPLTEIQTSSRDRFSIISGGNVGRATIDDITPKGSDLVSFRGLSLYYFVGDRGESATVGPRLGGLYSIGDFAYDMTVFSFKLLDIKPRTETTVVDATNFLYQTYRNLVDNSIQVFQAFYPYYQAWRISVSRLVGLRLEGTNEVLDANLNIQVNYPFNFKIPYIKNCFPIYHREFVNYLPLRSLYETKYRSNERKTELSSFGSIVNTFYFERAICLDTFVRDRKTYYLASGGERTSAFYILDDNFKVLAVFNKDHNTFDGSIIPRLKIKDRDNKLICSSPRTSQFGLDTPSGEAYAMEGSVIDRQIKRRKVIKLADSYYITSSPPKFFDGVNTTDFGYSALPRFDFQTLKETLDFPGDERIEIKNPLLRKARYAYNFAAVMVWRDANGREHVSGTGFGTVATEFPVGERVRLERENGTLLYEDVNFITVFLWDPPFEDKDYRIDIYRTEADKELYYLWKSFPASRIREARRITFNDKDVDFLKKKPRLIKGEYLTDDNFQPSNVKGFKLFENNVLVWGVTENNRLVYASRRFVFSDFSALEFNKASRFSFPEEVISVNRIDDKAVIFTTDKIFITNASRFRELNPVEIQKPPQVVPQGPEAIIEFEDGIMFKSTKGIFMIDRGNSVKYIGKEVEDYNAYECRKMEYSSDKKEIYVHVSNNVETVILILNKDFYRWSVIEPRPLEVRDLAVFDNELLYLTTDTVALKREAVSKDNPKDDDSVLNLNYRLTTGWINLIDLIGYGRIRKINILFRSEVLLTSMEGLTVDIRYNYDDAEVAEGIRERFTVRNGVFAPEGLSQLTVEWLQERGQSRRVLQCQPQDQKFQAIKLDFTVSTKVDFNIAGVAFEYAAVGINVAKTPGSPQLSGRSG